ncbi:hypothetical protein [Methanoregula sp.]|uniref:hypothetical protein n=1 Tax=Methanoregula sp. TaxID=2052170 RepID=UPI003BB19646
MAGSMFRVLVTKYWVFFWPSSKCKLKDPDVIRQFFEKFLMTGEQTCKEYRVQAVAGPAELEAIATVRCCSRILT